MGWLILGIIAYVIGVLAALVAVAVIIRSCADGTIPNGQEALKNTSTRWRVVHYLSCFVWPIPFAFIFVIFVYGIIVATYNDIVRRKVDTRTDDEKDRDMVLEAFKRAGAEFNERQASKEKDHG